ncbi:MAG: hypothetical protein VKP62_06770 [Candidatus Sericytochromatia bacterium]|nr:hypothetical protein [Candidatus Sericytochromatia bacterium]
MKSFPRALRLPIFPPPRSGKLRRRRRAVRTTAYGAASALAGALVAYGFSRGLSLPPVWAWSLFAALAVVGVAFIAWWQTHPRTHVLGAFWVAGMMVGAAGHALSAPPLPAGPLDPNRQTAERVLFLKQALERRGDYRNSLATEDFFPAPRDFVAFVLSQPRGHTLLISPWGDVPQYQTIAPNLRAGLPSAADRQRGIAAPPLGRELGPGVPPVPGHFTPLSYGTILYDRDLRSGRYVLYGIGKREDFAILVGFAEGEL